MPHSIPRMVGASPQSGAAGGTFLITVVLDRPGGQTEIFDVSYVVAGASGEDVLVSPRKKAPAAPGSISFTFALQAKRLLARDYLVYVKVSYKTDSAVGSFYVRR